MTLERYFELDNKLLAKKPKDYDRFRNGVEIVRLGDIGYLTVKQYEKVFNNERERKEYQAFSNDESLDLVVVSKMTDEELDELLSEQTDDWNCIVYYTISE